MRKDGISNILAALKPRLIRNRRCKRLDRLSLPANPRIPTILHTPTQSCLSWSATITMAHIDIGLLSLPSHLLPIASASHIRWRGKRGSCGSTQESIRQQVNTAFPLARINTASAGRPCGAQASGMGRATYIQSQKYCQRRSKCKSFHLLEVSRTMGRRDIPMGPANRSEQEHHDALRVESGRLGARSRQVAVTDGLHRCPIDLLIVMLSFFLPPYRVLRAALADAQASTQTS